VGSIDVGLAQLLAIIVNQHRQACMKTMAGAANH
jgi:hypothetical protein